MDKLNRFASVLALSAFFMSPTSFAAGGGAALEPAKIDPDNINSLQRGAANFMNYCSGCHSAEYVRFNTIGKDLELSEEMLVDNLMFNAEKTFETIQSAMPAEQAAVWYGKAPPDLSLMARAKGADYVYNFLKGFYIEEGSPTGVNNLVLAGTSMPHVLWELQGYQKAIFDHHENADGSVTTTFKEWEQLSEGELDTKDYDEFVRDTVNFLAYIAEPMRSDRRKLGVWVLMYLLFFLIIARMLKKQIWKDVK
ncbi:MAG: cytochrome c1 [Gammaproteobacteria bacterium]|nr:cytochrome c1 [Gammaproteobacteria bacterium]